MYLKYIWVMGLPSICKEMRFLNATPDPCRQFQQTSNTFIILWLPVNFFCIILFIKHFTVRKTCKDNNVKMIQREIFIEENKDNILWCKWGIKAFQKKMILITNMFDDPIYVLKWNTYWWTSNLNFYWKKTNITKP